MASINERVKRTVVEALILDLAPEELGDDENLSEKLGLDSVGFLEVLTALEDEFDVEIKNPGLTRLSAPTVRKLAEVVSQAQGERDGE
jgi:acyl carrier protein